jgi:EAL domain-containing protein (putative c-di-GMP-specific phosphodiesterase class I)/GGDEF domain-containing protein
VPRPRVSSAVSWTSLLGATALVAASVPSTVRFLPHAPAGFWVLVVLAPLVDLPLLGVARQTRVRVHSSMSTGLCLAILLRWGLGPAILVQTLSASTCTALQCDRPFGPFHFVRRHILALGAAGLAASLLQPRPLDGLSVRDLLATFIVIATLGASSLVLLVINRALFTGRKVSRTWEFLVSDVLINTMSQFFVVPLLAAVDGWWSPIIALPLVTRNLINRQNRRQEERASEDPLTGIASRPGLDAVVEELTLYDHAREPDLPPFSVVLLNADVILTVYRTLARPITNKLIREYTLRFLRDNEGIFAAHPRARVGRLAGEGLVVIAPRLSQAETLTMAQSAAQSMRRRIEIDGIPFLPDTVAGIAISPEHGRDLDALLQGTGRAVGEARRLGEQVHLFVPDAVDPTQRRVAVLTEMYAVLGDPGRIEEIAVLYEPQVDIGTGRLTGVEATFAWTHPRWGPVSADHLVEAIGTSEVMHMLTRHVLGQVLLQMQDWNARGRPLPVAVAASVRDLHASTFVDEIDRALRQHGIGPAQLTIGISERTATGEDARVLVTANRLHDLGVGLSIDDFGTGQASLQQLRSLPVTAVKIDRSYVSRMHTDPDDRATVTSVHQLATALGLGVVAEGVEDERIAAALAALPGTVGQGGHYGRPGPADAVFTRPVSPGRRGGTA